LLRPHERENSLTALFKADALPPALRQTFCHE